MFSDMDKNIQGLVVKLIQGYLALQGDATPGQYFLWEKGKATWTN